MDAGVTMEDNTSLEDNEAFDPAFRSDIRRGLTPRMSVTPEPRGHPSNTHRQSALDDEAIAEEVAHATPEKRVSFYLQAVEDMIHTVMLHENFLFSDNEKAALQYFMKLDRESRYLFIRLYLRKPKWIRLDQNSMMDYVNSYGDLTDLDLAVERLCDPVVLEGSSGLTQFESLKPEISETSATLNAIRSESKLPVKLDITNGLDRGMKGEPGPRTTLTLKKRKAAVEAKIKNQKPKSNEKMIDLTSTTDEEMSDNDIIIFEEPAQVGLSHNSVRPERNNLTVIDRGKGKKEALNTVEAISKFKEALEAEMDFSRIAYDHTVLARRNTEEILKVMSKDELEELGKRMKVKPTNTNREGWVQALIKTSTQSTLSFVKSSVSVPMGKISCSDEELDGATSNYIAEPQELKPKCKSFLDIHAPFGVQYDDQGKKYSASGVVHLHALRTIGPCIHLAPGFIALFDRLKLIYFRTGQLSETLTDPLTTSLLVRFGKRKYPDYVVSRSFSIFPNMRILRDYEAALELEYKMEVLLETSPPPMTTRKIKKTKRRMKGEGEEEDTWQITNASLSDPAMRAKVEAYQIEKRKILMEGVTIYEGVESRWQNSCKEGAREEKLLKDQERRLLYYKMRFHPGWPLTRVVYKAAQVYAKLGDHDEEQRILRMLLAQYTFRRGLRGAWYDRLALVLMNYGSKEEDAQTSLIKKKKMTTKRMEEARRICLDGLKDPHTHLIYHSSLKRRIIKLERGKVLLTPEEDKIQFPDLVAKAEQRVIYGERLDDPTTGLHSIWRGELGDNVSVEQLALEEYKRLGWDGFHSENSILTSLFALLFWDIIFAPIDGVFETPYQSAPLDLATDAFHEVRRPLVKKRLQAIRKGEASEILARHDDRERSFNTWCVGLNWVRYSKIDLINIAEGIGSSSLAIVMTMFVEEYGHRRGGVPDLCLYNPIEKSVMFSEVKGPGDRLSETQKVWIDVLLRAGVRVELCSVLASDDKSSGE